jgi:hypothetical protein
VDPRASRSPVDAPARARTVITFYGAAALVGFFWHAIAQDSNDIWRVDPEQGWQTLLWTPLVGAAVGLVVVQLFRALEGRFAWLPSLHAEFRALLGRPAPQELILLAATSAVGEELIFRGAMLDAWGLWPSTIVFALLHIPPKLALWPWTASSLAIGLLLGELTLLTGNLGAAVVAHFVINLQNLFYITRNPPRPAISGPVRPASPEN